ncbi:MAG TPA: protein translocase subunit SecD [Candidatus Limnocylindrales bacterium]|jgi:preprotein translocase subunit SecD|nr:protein translocase subunit SecD [Candidatus Limnocylindrales bacterium]
MRKTGPILIVVIGTLALLVDFYPGLRLPDLGGQGARTVETKLGLDLEGGLRVEYQALPVEGRSPDAAALGIIRDIVERRVNQTGVAEPVVTTQGSDRIVIEMPGATDRQAIERLVGQTGRLDFVPIPPDEQPPVEGTDLDLTTHPVLFSGDQVESATIGTHPTTGGRTVNFVLKPVGATLFAQHTAAHIGEFFAITLDGNVISAPSIRDAIPNGQVVIEAGGAGGFSLKEATELTTVLKFGSLPFPITQVSAEQISATLGSEFLDRSLLAGALGILLVLVFMAVHYRLPGVIAGFALMYYTLVVLAIFRLVPVTLTLAGIAGFVLSVGMAVDANILIFERSKEELRLGKSLPAAIEAGFSRAWNSILDSNVSSLITATILFLFGSSVIRGFALVLIIGVLVSMFSAITVTRTILRTVVQRDWARRAALYGVNDSEFVARPTGRAALRGEARGRV